MNRPGWIGSFLGGVADSAFAHALLRDATGHAVLVDLTQGRRMWRSAEPVHPLALDGELAFGLAFGPPVRVVALDAASATERWRSAPLPWPSWATSAEPAGGMYASSVLHVGWVEAASKHAPADLLLAWRLLRPSHGAHRAAPPQPEFGASRIARSDGSIAHLDDAAALLDAAARGTDAEHVESLDPDVLAQQRWQGMRYALALRPAGAAGSETRLLVLEVRRDAGSAPADSAEPAAPAAWHCVLDDAPVPRRSPKPFPPRP